MPMAGAPASSQSEDMPPEDMLTGSEQPLQPPVDASSLNTLPEEDWGPDPDCRAASVAVGGFHVCAVSNGGRVYCWGGNGYRQLGVDSIELDCESQPGQPQVPCPYTRQPTHVPSLANVREVALGLVHTCALRSDGMVYCWGSNASGTLGVGGPGRCSVGVDVIATDGTACLQTPVSPLDDAIALGAWGQTCAVLSTGEVHCWAEGGMHGWESLVDIEYIDAGCALDGARNVHCWGDNLHGMRGSRVGEVLRCAGTPDIGCEATAVSVPPSMAMDVGYAHACIVSESGELWCWGSNDAGQLGLDPSGPELCGGFRPCSPMPVRVSGLPKVRAVAASGRGTCAIDEGGEVWCVDALAGAPRRLPMSSAAVRIEAGYETFCAVLEDGGISCWGDDKQGKLGPLSSYDDTGPEHDGGPYRVSLCDE